MVFAQFQCGLERDQDTMAGHLANETPNKRVLLSKNFICVVVAHRAVNCTGVQCYNQRK
jgi:hypothetical protein